MEIKRDGYISRLNGLRFKGGAKIVTGVRRCGKSYLLFRLYRDELVRFGVSEDHIVMIALDSIENKSLRDADALYRKIDSLIVDGAPYFVMIDEVQMADGFVDVVNSLLRRDNVDIYITGSSSRFLSSDIVTEFRGRGTEIRVRPLSFSEYLGAVDTDERAAWRSYLTYGGLPATVEMDDGQKVEYLTQLVNVVYLRDVVERRRIQHPEVLDMIFEVLSSDVGSLTNPHRVSDVLSGRGYPVDCTTVSGYMAHLEDTFLFEESKRFDLKGNGYIGTPLKYYATDLGLRNAKLGFRQNEYPHLMENAVYNELRSRGFSVDVGVIGIREYVQGKREYKQLEIDFVATRGGLRYYIQSAFRMDDPEKERQEMRPFLKLNDGFRKIILVGDDVPVHVNEKGFVIMNVIDFMKDSEIIGNL